jgi:putative transposase
VGLSARTIERWRARPHGDDQRCGPHRRPGNALSAVEETQIVSVLRSTRYAHLSPKQLVPQLADEGVYLASESTFYRLQRRLGLRPGSRAVSRTDITRASTIHRAFKPNQVWSWDITWLPTIVRGVYLHLYLVMDVWSRKIVGWRIAETGSAQIASELITRACRDGNVDPRGLVLHADNGKPMRGSTMIATLQWLGVIPSFSRPHVSDDNPYSEALFRTLKHTPAYPRTPFAGISSIECLDKGQTFVDVVDAEGDGIEGASDPFQRRVMFLVRSGHGCGQEVEVRMRPADILRWARFFSSDALDPLALC